MKNRSAFKSDKEFFRYLVENKKELIEFKKAAQKFADAFVFSPGKSPIAKSLSTSYRDDPASGSIKRTVIGNTYNWLDSHDDVHIDGCFSKSINENQNRIWHLHDHEQKSDAKVGRPSSIYEKSVDWTDLGVEVPGKTQALFMDSNILKVFNAMIFDQYLNGDIDQHSVGMYYVLMDLAINDKELKEEYANWNKYISAIGNKDKATQQGYFWAVKEAKLVEISCVLEGSNKLTPAVPNIEPEKTTCVNCGADVIPDESGMCPECSSSVKSKKTTFLSRLGKQIQS